MIKIALPNYTNSILYSEGLKKPSEFSFNNTFTSPSHIYTLFENQKIDMALIPSIFFLKNRKDINILPKFCIGSNHKVKSVCLFSEVPIKDITTIFLDYQSKTSNALLLILLKEYWQIQPKIIYSSNDIYIKKIKDNTAGVIIGDRALEITNKKKYCYDLVEIWKELTGLPFVFAVWGYYKSKVSTRILNHLINIFHQSIKDVSTITDPSKYKFDIQTYLIENISFNFDTLKKKSLELFLYKMSCYAYTP